VWSWHPLLVLSLAEVLAAQPGTRSHSIRAATVAKRNSSPGRARISRKTIAWGMPDVTGASAVNTRAHTNYPKRARGCGCIGHPAFPAPSVFEGRCEFARLACCARRDREGVSGLRVIARSTCDEAIQLRPCGARDCFAGARNDGVSAEAAV
jgi:hypothetical protein